jgi:hypothetical protein
VPASDAVPARGSGAGRSAGPHARVSDRAATARRLRLLGLRWFVGDRAGLVPARAEHDADQASDGKEKGAEEEEDA